MSGRFAPQMTDVQLFSAEHRVFTEAQWMERARCPGCMTTPTEIALLASLTIVCIGIPLLCIFRLRRVVRWLRQDLAELKLRRVHNHVQ